MLITQIYCWLSWLARVTAVITACVDLTFSCETVQVVSDVSGSWQEWVWLMGGCGTRPGHMPVREGSKRKIRYYCDLLHKLFETSCTGLLFKTSAVRKIVFMHFFKCLTLSFIQCNILQQVRMFSSLDILVCIICMLYIVNITRVNAQMCKLIKDRMLDLQRCTNFIYGKSGFLQVWWS